MHRNLALGILGAGVCPLPIISYLILGSPGLPKWTGLEVWIAIVSRGMPGQGIGGPRGAPGQGF